MTHPTLRSLVSKLNQNLVPVPGFAVTDAEVFAVHVSELADPTLWLSGGELLLTTGIALPAGASECTQYVDRLVAAGIVGLGFGIGAVFDEVPPPLVAACRASGLPLFVVRTTFLAVSRAYWTMVAREGEQLLLDQLAYQRSLVDAARSADPTEAVLRILSRSVDGWSAVYNHTGSLERTHPESATEQAAEFSTDLARMITKPGTATFITNERHVVMFPLSTPDRTLGFVAVSADKQLTPAERQTALTAASLLVLLASQKDAEERGSAVARTCVATLIDLDMIEAASRLSNAVGAPSVPGRVRVLIVRSPHLDRVIAAVYGWCDRALGGVEDSETAWFVLPAGVRSPDELGPVLVAIDPSVRASLSQPVRVHDVSGTKLRELGAVGALPPGATALSLPLPPPPQLVQQGLTKLMSHSRPDMIDAVVAYLGHRGHWEQAARQLDVHRNTLRYRIDRAREITGLDLDDPDVAAYLWLWLRDRTSS